MSMLTSSNCTVVCSVISVRYEPGLLRRTTSVQNTYSPYLVEISMTLNGLDLTSLSIKIKINCEYDVRICHAPTAH